MGLLADMNSDELAMSKLDPTPLDLTHRPRRLRRNSSTLAMVAETRISPEQLIAPLFVKDGDGAPDPVGSMPGVFRLSISDLVKECQELWDAGIRAVALFPCTPSSVKTPFGDYSLNPQGLTPSATRAIKASLPNMNVIVDLALDPYTSHGHDGILDASETWVENDLTVRRLAEMAVIYAEAGADWVAPSDMMDGRVGAIRRSLDLAGHQNVAIMAYSAKFASAYYGPFREAIGSGAAVGQGYLDKRSYQLNPTNRREAIRDALLDESEGADILMVKPAGPFLDIIRELREQTRLPLAAYQVSGEYAQIHAAAQMKWLDYKRTRDESLIAIKRAGADLILTYFAKEWAQEH